jgi:hypothetical protein
MTILAYNQTGFNIGESGDSGVKEQSGKGEKGRKGNAILP